MSYVTFRTRPQDNKNLKKLCKQLKVNRSEALRLAIETAVSVLERQSSKKLSGFIGSFEGPENLSTECQATVKKKLKDAQERS